MTIVPLYFFALLSFSMPTLTISESAPNPPSSQVVAVSRCQTGCPPEAEWARDMVEGLLEDSRLQAETQTEGITAADVELVQDSTTCAQLSAVTPEFPYPDHVETYYQADSNLGRRYFVVWTRQPPDDPDVILYAMSFINVLDEAFNHIGGYMW